MVLPVFVSVVMVMHMSVMLTLCCGAVVTLAAAAAAAAIRPLGDEGVGQGE